MTTAQRNNHIKAIEALLIENGYTLNRYGKYQKGKVRIDTRKVNMKVECEDFKLFSVPMVSLKLGMLKTKLIRWDAYCDGGLEAVNSHLLDLTKLADDALAADEE